MAEGGKPQQPVINLYFAGAPINVQGDNVGSKTEVGAGKIGRIMVQQPDATSYSPAQPARISKGVESMNIQTDSFATPMQTDDLRVQDLQTKTDRKPNQLNKTPPRTQELNQQPKQTAAGPRYTTAQSGINAPKISMLRKKSSKLFDESKYEEAVSILEELATLQNHQDLDTILMMVECFIQLGREKKAEKSIAHLRNILMASSVTSADDVKTLAIDLISNSAYIRAIILLRIASDIYKARTRSPDDVINGIKLCVSKIHDATESLIKAGGRSKIIGVDYGIEYMTEMLDDVRAIENADPVNKAIQEALCCEYIGYNYLLADEEEKSIKIQKNGLEVLEKQFGSNASKYQIYGLLLHNIGVGYYNLGKYAEAESYYIKAIDAYEKASDYENEAEKQKWIELSKTELRKARAQLT
uniref:uncharacterized protein LOC120330239 isoform X2 n=1 Tax=Styela clava TaxID=7725 RepID=UPI00193AC8D6|nr:uncharacterized protein LOC120330239 isoform X2 [Styela clava]